MQESFPVTASTLAPSALLEFLCRQYNLHGSTTCKLFRTGINHLSIVTTPDHKFVFRVYTHNWRTEVEIHEEVRLLNLLTQNSVPVAYPLSDKNHNFVQTLNAPEGKRFGVLFSFAPGGKVPVFSEVVSYNVGVAMARMHGVTKDQTLKRITYTAETLLVSSLKKAKAFFKNDSSEMIFVEKATAHLISEYKNVKVSEVRYGAVHLDIWFDNMHFEGENITIFDFDFCGNGWLAHDIAYFLLQLYNTQPSELLFEEKSKAFLKGYESIHKISEEEKRILPLLAVSIWFFYLGVQCDRFDNWSNIFLGEEHLKRFIGMIKKWMKYSRLELESN